MAENANKRYVDSPKEIDGIRVVQDDLGILEALKRGETVLHWESGNSMYPILQNMEYCKICPTKPKDVRKGDPVFCSFNYIHPETHTEEKAYMVHRCTDIYNRDSVLYFKIETTDGYCYGWTKDVYGIAKSTNIFQQ